MIVRNFVIWNFVINGFLLNGRFIEVLIIFRDMNLEGVEFDGFIMVSLLCVCVEFGVLVLGRRVYIYMFKVGLIENLYVGNVFLDFYVKCGRIKEVERVFNEMRGRSVVFWIFLIVGLAVNGLGIEVIEFFKEMEMEGLVLMEIILVGVLYVCSYCGMVKEGFDYFNAMK